MSTTKQEIAKICRSISCSGTDENCPGNIDCTNLRRFNRKRLKEVLEKLGEINEM